MDGQPDTRQRLINALAVVVARDGYGPSKIADVAREAKVSLRTFYSVFESKEACFLALYAQATDGLLILMHETVTFEGEWRHEMKRGFAAHLRALTYEPNLTYAALIELATLSPEARRVRQDWYERLAMALCAQVEEGRRHYPEIPSRSLPEQMARMILGGLSEMIVDLIVRDRIDRLPDLAESATDLLWSVVTGNSQVPLSFPAAGPDELTA